MTPELGGLKGGAARAASLSPKKRSAIATKAAKARWGKKGLRWSHLHLPALLVCAALAEAQTEKPIPNIPNTDDVQSLISYLMNLQAGVKGEFETTAQFKARQEKATTQLDRKYVFPLTYDDFAYDADRSIMQGSLVITMERFDSDPGYSSAPCLWVRSIVSDTPTSYVSEEFGVLLSRESASWLRSFIDKDGSLPDREKIVFSLPLDIEHAKEIKPSLRILISGSVPKAQVHNDSQFYRAREGNSAQATLRLSKHYVDFALDEIRIVDSRTGKVVARYASDVKASTEWRQKAFGPGFGGAYKLGGGVTAPTVVYKVEPEYSEQGRKAKLQGTVVLSVVVDERGIARDLKVLRHLGLGLDQKAIEAVQKWKFRPGMKDGHPVPVYVTIEVNFR